MNKLLTDRVKLIRALQACTKAQYSYLGDEDALKDIIKRIRADHKPFLSLSQDKDGRVSYSIKPETKLDNKHRVRTSLGRYFRRQLNISCDKIGDKSIAWIQAQVFARTADIDGSVTIVQGKDIQQAYNDDFGGHTCMSGGDYSEYTKLYADNPGVVVMVKYDNGVGARALLWKTKDGTKILDRIYPDDGGAHIVAIRLWAEKQGYIVRGHNQLFSGDDLMPLSDGSERHIRLRDNGKYPYLDTFCFGTITEGCRGVNYVYLSNKRKGGDHIFQDTSGRWLEEFTCCRCDENIAEGNVRSHGGNRYCEDCFNDTFSYCANCDDHYDSDSMIYCSDGGMNYCECCANEELFRCPRCDEYHQNMNVFKAADTEDEYCEDCAGDILTCCGECGDLYEKQMEKIAGVLYCPNCAADRKQKDPFKNRRKPRKAAVAV